MDFLGNTNSGLTAVQLEKLNSIQLSEDGQVTLTNPIITGSLTEIKTEQIVVSDPLIILGNNQVSDVDGGFSIASDNNTKYSGLIRKNGSFYLTSNGISSGDTSSLGNLLLNNIQSNGDLNLTSGFGNSSINLLNDGKININGTHIDFNNTSTEGINVSDLKNVQIITPGNDQVLTYVTNKWKNRPLPSAPVTSVNTGIGDVVLDADDIDDTSTSNKFFTQALVSANTDVKANKDHSILVTTNPHNVSSFQVGLGNVTNVAQIPLTQKDQIGGVAILDASRLLNIDRIPMITTSKITNFNNDVANSSQVILNTAHKFLSNPHGITKAKLGLNNVIDGLQLLSSDKVDWPNSTVGKILDAKQINLGLDTKADVSHSHTISDITNFTTSVTSHSQVSQNTTHRGLTNNPHNVSADQVGLSNLTNDLQLKVTDRAALNGVASLENGKIPTSQLPSLAITDVFPVANIAARDLLITNDTIQKGDIAVVSSNNKTYIWDGTSWIVLQEPSAAAPITSVNTKTGVVSLITDDISDSTSSNKWYNNTYVTNNTNVSNATSHLGDGSIHFTESNIDHKNIQNIGTNDHTQIDSHIGDNLKHRIISDLTTSTTALWSSYKINTELGTKAGALDELTDVVLGTTTVAEKDVLSYDITSNKWINKTILAANLASESSVIANYQRLDRKNIASGYCPLDSSVRVPQANLPDIIEIEDYLSLKDDDDNKIILQAPVNVVTDYTLTLPANQSNVNQILENDGNGVLEWKNTPVGINLPNIITQIGSDFDVKYSMRGLVTHGDFLYLVTENVTNVGNPELSVDSVFIAKYDLSNVEFPKLVNRILVIEDNNCFFENIKIAGKYVYAQMTTTSGNASTDGLYFYDTTPYELQPLEFKITPAEGFQDGIVVGRYCYILLRSSPNRIRVFDLLNTNPLQRGGDVILTRTITSWLSVIKTDGNYLYICGGSSNGYSLVDLSDPLLPVNLGNITAGNLHNYQISDIEFLGNTAYFSSSSANTEIRKYDITDPINPVQILINVSAPGDPASYTEIVSTNNVGVHRNMLLIGEYLIIAKNQANPAGFRILNAYDLTELTNWNTDAWILNIALIGKHLVALKQQSSDISIFDLRGSNICLLESCNIKTRTLNTNNLITNGASIKSLNVGATSLLGGDTLIDGDLKISKITTLMGDLVADSKVNITGYLTSINNNMIDFMSRWREYKSSVNSLQIVKTGSTNPSYLITAGNELTQVVVPEQGLYRVSFNSQYDIKSGVCDCYDALLTLITDLELVSQTTRSAAYGNGETITAGSYHSAAAIIHTGVLTFSGSSTDVFIIKTAGAYTANSSCSCAFTGGAQASNVYWIIEGAVNFGNNCNVSGTYISKTTYFTTMSNFTLEGRLLTKAGYLNLANINAQVPDGTSIYTDLTELSDVLFYTKAGNIDCISYNNTSSTNWKISTDVGNITGFGAPYDGSYPNSGDISASIYVYLDNIKQNDSVYNIFSKSLGGSIGLNFSYTVDVNNEAKKTISIRGLMLSSYGGLTFTNRSLIAIPLYN